MFHVQRHGNVGLLLWLQVEMDRWMFLACISVVTKNLGSVKLWDEKCQ